MLARGWLLIAFTALIGCRTTSQRTTPVAHGPAPSAATVVGIQHIGASNHRRWEPSLAVLPYARVSGDEIHLHNIRNCRYSSEHDYVVDHYDATYDLNKLESVDFIVVPFKDIPELAHTMLSFGFENGRHVIVSVEARLEDHEEYSPLSGMLRRYELMYLLGDERDLILLRTEHRDADVYVYRVNSTGPQRRALLIDMAKRMNQLVEAPEFYDSFANNCTTNIVRHLNYLKPGMIPLDFRTLLPGSSDRLAYELGLLESDLPFQVVKRRAHVNKLAHRHQDDPDFSRKIRRE